MESNAPLISFLSKPSMSRKRKKKRYSSSSSISKRNRHSSHNNVDAGGIFLPTDLIVSEILVRLPCKSLSRFKCVSKEWYEILSTSKTFIYSHLKRSQDASSNGFPSALMLLICDPQTGSLFCYPDIDALMMKVQLNTSTNYGYVYHECFKKPLEFYDVTPPYEDWISINVGKYVNSFADYILNVPPSDCEAWISIGGYCNGLICLCDSGNNMALYNPINRNYRKLPTLDEPKQKPGARCSAVGFYYDSFIDDYKIVKFIIPDDNTVITNEVWEFSYKVYSMRTHSWATKSIHVNHQHDPCYGPIPFRPGFKFCADNCVGAFLNDTLHWTVAGTKGLFDHHHIVTFHIRTEQFSYIPMPSCSEIHRSSVASLGGYLFVILWKFYDGDILYCELWILQEYGRFDSWKKLFYTREIFVYPVAYYPKRAEGDILLIILPQKLVQYNIKNQSFEPIIDINIPVSYELVMVGSLVPIPKLKF